MPFLPFEAIDSNGKTIRGTFQANSVQELEAILRQKGLRPVSVGTQPAHTSVPPQRQPQTIGTSLEHKPTRPHVQTPAMAAAQQSLRTPELTNKQRYFLFHQFSSFTKSGFSPSQMIQHASAKMPTKLRAAFAEMEQETAGGMAMSDSMERRPMLFSPDQVATVRAGEQSGQMPEAFDVLALQADRANAFRLTLGYFFFMFPILILCGVGGIGLQKASQETIQKQFDADGQLDKWGTLIAEVKTRLPHEFLLSFIIAAGFVIAIIVLHKYPFRKFRHRAGLMVPTGQSRAKSEAIERFSWAMSAMLKGGASPASAVHIAASSIPNLVMREQALNAVGLTRENEPLGSMLQRSGLLSPEYVHIVQNGELVGDTPGALGTIARAESDSFQVKTTRLKVVANLTTLAIMGIFTAVLVGFLYYMYANNMVRMLNNVQ